MHYHAHKKRAPHWFPARHRTGAPLTNLAPALGPAPPVQWCLVRGLLRRHRSRQCRRLVALEDKLRGAHQRPRHPLRVARPAALAVVVEAHPAGVEVEQHADAVARRELALRIGVGLSVPPEGPAVPVDVVRVVGAAVVLVVVQASAFVNSTSQ